MYDVKLLRQAIQPEYYIIIRKLQPDLDKDLISKGFKYQSIDGAHRCGVWKKYM